MSHDDDIIQIVLHEINDHSVIIKSDVDVELSLANIATATLNIITLPDIPILVDLDNLGFLDSGEIPGLGLGRFVMPITFVKSIIGRKHTFGQVVFNISNNRNISATGSEYGSGMYDGGGYGGMQPKYYGYGLYGIGLYGGGSSGATLLYGATSYPIIFTKSVNGRKTTFGSISRTTTFNKSVTGTQAKQTTTAEISLAYSPTPTARNNHAIKIRARTLVGSGAVIKAALYEGSTNRSGDLTTAPLSNLLTDYTLFISEASANAITSYSNLSIRVWGVDSSGVGLIFEISSLYLAFVSLPVVTRSITFTKEVSGTKKTFGVTARPTTFTKVVAGQKTTFGSISRATTFTKAVSGNIVSAKQTPVADVSLASHVAPAVRDRHAIKIKARTTSGSTGVIKAALYESSNNRSGDLTSTPLSTSLTDYTLTIPDASAATITSYNNLSIRFWGYDAQGNALVFEVSRVYLELPVS